MIEVEEKIESRCGIECSLCEFKDTMNCKGCTNIDKPFHGKCAGKKCAEEKNLKCCGECKEFPCDLLNSYAYDPAHGDNGARIEKCKNWCKINKD